ncbi:nucleotidyltransferase domain-containing protein [Microbacterium sp. EST19A]|uniref:nucleotidyltransferase domain-containing protein n=1 Tax=Microbacterium sp. EST19A TaxID=2862681 RepID=UPI001CC0CFAB|nr:hypothetical protein [Microbacterium sp. EST19A]
MDHEEIVRLYGPWRSRGPADVVALFDGYAHRWWLAGGWAVEAFTGVARPHGDIDPSVPRADAATLLDHLEGEWDVWAADRGTLTPLVGDDPAISPTCSNLWLRRSGAGPWEYDVILMDATEELWTYKRDPRITLPFGSILWEYEGVRYLRPEVQLLHKARGLRPEDQQDFETASPLLEAGSARWLRAALETAHPGHPWIAALMP